MVTKQPSFAERINQLGLIVSQLEDAANTVRAEVLRMEAAQERFAQKRQSKTAR